MHHCIEPWITLKDKYIMYLEKEPLLRPSLPLPRSPLHLLLLSRSVLVVLPGPLLILSTAARGAASTHFLSTNTTLNTLFQLFVRFETIVSQGVREEHIETNVAGRLFQSVQTPFCPFHLISTFFPSVTSD